MNKVFISKDEKTILQDILVGDFDILLFGSRVKGNHQRFSDLDVCLKGKVALDRYLLARFREALSDSDLPYMVDLIDYYAIDLSFRQLVEKQAVSLEDAIAAQ